MVLFFRFKVKGVKSKKEAVEYKLMAPDTKDFGAITQLLLTLRREGEDIHVLYQFKVKKLDYVQAGVQAVDKLIEIDQVLTPKDYKQFGDSPNQDKMKQFLGEALDSVKRKTLI